MEGCTHISRETNDIKRPALPVSDGLPEQLQANSLTVVHVALAWVIPEQAVDENLFFSLGKPPILSTEEAPSLGWSWWHETTGEKPDNQCEKTFLESTVNWNLQKECHGPIKTILRPSPAGELVQEHLDGVPKSVSRCLETYNKEKPLPARPAVESPHLKHTCGKKGAQHVHSHECCPLGRSPVSESSMGMRGTTTEDSQTRPAGSEALSTCRSR